MAVNVNAQVTTHLDDGQKIQDAYRLAAGFYARSQWSDAIAAFDQLISDYPGTPQASTALFFKGEALVQQTKYKLAYQSFDQFLSANPKSAYAERANFRRAEAAFFSTSTDQALKRLDDFQSSHPESKFNEFVLAYRAQCLLTKGKGKDSIELYKQCLKEFPESSLSDKNKLGLAQAYQLTKQTSEARAIFQSLAEQSRHYRAAALIGLGHLEFRQRKFGRAESAYQTFLNEYKAHSHRCTVAYWLGRSQMAQENWKQALKSLQRVEAKNCPEDVVAASRYDNAVCHVKLGELAPAKSRLQELLKNWPSSKWADDALTLMIEIEDREGNSSRVLSLSNELQQKHPSSPFVFQALEKAGRVQYQSKQFQESEATFAKLLQMTTTAGPRILSQRKNWQ